MSVFCEHANESPRGGACSCPAHCTCREGMCLAEPMPAEKCHVAPIPEPELAVLARIDADFARLDEGAKRRALDYLRAKYLPNANLPEATPGGGRARISGAELHGWPTRIC